MQSEACFGVLNVNVLDAFVKIPKRPQREEFPHPDTKKAPWQQMIDSGSFKLTKKGRTFRQMLRLPASKCDLIVATVRTTETRTIH